MITTKQLAEYILAHPGIKPRNVCKNLKSHNVHHSDVYAAMRLAAVKLPAVIKSGVGKPSKRMSRSQFAAQFDKDTRIRESLETGIKSLSGTEDVMEDSTFRVERCSNAPSTGWKIISSEPKFKPYRFCIKNRVFWGSVETKQWAMKNVEGVHEA